MDSLSDAASDLIVHNVEIYTARLFTQGNVSGPFKRISDLMNRRDAELMTVRDAAVTPLGQPGAASKVQTPILVGRSHIHFVSLTSSSPAVAGGKASTSGELVVEKVRVPCYALTDAFIIYGYCHLLKGATLEDLLNMSATFIPFTKATIYLASKPTAPWQREVVIANKEKLEAIYLADK